MVQVLEEGGGGEEEEEDDDEEEDFSPSCPRESKVGCKNKTCKTAQDQEVARLTLSIVFIRYL